MIALRENKVLGEINIPENKRILSLLAVNTGQRCTPIPLEVRGCSRKTLSLLGRTLITIFRQAVCMPFAKAKVSTTKHYLGKKVIFTLLSCLRWIR